jgi:hypothetical protein
MAEKQPQTQIDLEESIVKIAEVPRATRLHLKRDTYQPDCNTSMYYCLEFPLRNSIDRLNVH